MSADVTASPAGPEESYGDELKKGTELLRGQYRIARFLNAGGFGITYLARDSLDRIVVIKECFPSTMCCRQDDEVRVRSQAHEQEFQKIVQLFGQEARALAKLEHPNIVGVHQVFEDNNTAYMALDFVRGRDLLDVFDEERERLTPDLVRNLLVKVLEAVEYIHDRGILHRDIAPDNILLDQSGEPVLIDFGAAREEATRMSRVLTHQHTVKDGYSPQEFYVSGSAQTVSSDLYSLGATFYHLIAGEAPPVSQSRLAKVAANQADPYTPLAGRLQDFPGYDRFFLAAVDKALEVFPDDRMQSAREWLTEIDTERRRAAAKERAQKDKQLAKVIRDLVSETNEFVKSAKETEVRNPRKVRVLPVRRKKPMFPELMGPPPPESSPGDKGAPPVIRPKSGPPGGDSERAVAASLPPADGTGAEDEGIVARPQISPSTLGDEKFLKDEVHRRKILDRVLHVSLWRFGQVEESPGKIVGKVDR